MLRPNFNLQESRFERIEVTGVDRALSDISGQDLRLHFTVNFPSTKEECGSNSFDIRLWTKVTRLEADSEKVILSALARGTYAFEDGVDPYLVEDRFERVFAAGLLYAGLRPLLDSILGMSGFAGLKLPTSLPHAMMDKPAAAPVDSDQPEPEIN